MSNKVRLAFIGSGNIAGSHAACLAKMTDDATIVAFADSQVDRARALTEKHGGHAYASYDEMFERESLDAVLLCTPHFVRREAIAAIAARKLALFCEKPPAFTVEEARVCCDIDDARPLPIEWLTHGDRTFPGDGVLPWRRWVEEIKDRTGFIGPWSVELHSDWIWKLPPAEAMERLKRGLAAP